MLLQLLANFLCTTSFCILFSAPKSEWLFCGAVGTISWTIYAVIQQTSGHATLATLIATMLLTLLSRVLANARKKPGTIFLIPGIFPIVPGAGIYYTSYYLISGDMAAFSKEGIKTLEIAIAIALGIIFSSAVPERLFKVRWFPPR